MNSCARKYFANALLLSAVSVAMRAVAVSFNAYVTKKIGTEAVGLFTLVMSVYALCVTLAASGVNLAAVRLVSEECARCEACGFEGREKRTRLKKEFSGCVKYSLFFGFFAGALLFILSDTIGVYALSDARTVPSLRVLALSLPPIALTSALAGFFTGLRKVWKNAVVSVSEQFVKICLVSALLVIIAPDGIEHACLAVVGGSAVAEGASLIISVLLYITDRTGAKQKPSSGKAPHEAPLAKKDPSSPLSRAVGIAFPVACGSYIRQGLVCAEHLAIPRGLAKSGSGYSAALSSYGVLHGMVFPLILFPASVIGAFASLLIPELSAARATGEGERISRITERAFRVCLWFSVGTAALFMTFSSQLGNAVYSNAEAGRYISLFSPLIPVMYLDTCVDAVLKGVGEQVYCMKVNIVDATLSLILVIVLVPRLGVGGYVICVFVTECVNAALSISRLVAVSRLAFCPSWLITPVLSAAVSSAAARLFQYAAFPPAACAAICVFLYFTAFSVAEIRNCFRRDMKC